MKISSSEFISLGLEADRLPTLNLVPKPGYSSLLCRNRQQ
jgi:hypothetical protein